MSIVLPLTGIASSGEPSEGRKVIVAVTDPSTERDAVPAYAEARPG